MLPFITLLKEYSVALFLNALGSEVIGTTMIQVSEQGGMGPVTALAVVHLAITASDYLGSKWDHRAGTGAGTLMIETLDHVDGNVRHYLLPEAVILLKE